MSTLPTAEWTAALNQMSTALEQSLTNLDRYRNEWHAVTDNPVKAAPPEELLTGLERKLILWDDRLNAAAELAASVEKQLEDRESAMERWHEVFVRWQELIQNRMVAPSDSPR